MSGVMNRHRYKIPWSVSVKCPINSKLLCVITVLILATSIQAMDVSGIVGGTWTSAETVRVTGDILIPGDSLLIIEPGTRVEFSGAYKFEVNGVISAVGNLDNFITFTAENPPVDSLTRANRWRGIRIINAKRGCELAFCRIEHGWARGVWPENCGGGIYIEGCPLTVRNSEIFYNHAEGDGGGIYCSFTTAELKNNLVIANSAMNFGGGFFITYSNPSILNCTVAFDTAGGWGGGLFIGSEGKPVIKNSIVTYNLQDGWDGTLPPGDTYYSNIARARSAAPVVIFSDIFKEGAEPFSGQGNIGSNPQFLNIQSEPYDFHLAYTSPCIDAGDPQMSAGEELDERVNRINLGAYGGTVEATLSVPVIYVREAALNVQTNFGSVKVPGEGDDRNFIVTKEFTIENRGHWRLLIDDFFFTTPVFTPEMAENDDGDLVPIYTLTPIEPGESNKYSINFKPDSLRTYTDTLRISTNDAFHPAPILRLTGVGVDPQLVMQVDTLNFGHMQIGETHEVTVTVSNEGRSDLIIDGMTIQGDVFGASYPDDPIPPGQSAQITITFEPNLPEAFEGSATIFTNDADSLIILQGRGVGPKMEIETDSLFLGYVYVGGDTSIYTVEVVNSGDMELLITGADIDNNGFSVSLPVGGFSVAPRSAENLPIRFHPLVADSIYEGTLDISGNYPISHSIELSGRGMAEPGRYVFGEVSGVWNWSDDSQDYIVLDSVLVPAHQKLKIEAGARILFEPGAFMRVFGELRALGLEGDSIYFLPRDISGTLNSRWHSLQLYYEDGTRLNYCVINGSLSGVGVFESSPLIQFTHISNNGDVSVASGGGVFIENSGVHLHGCLIEGNKAITGGGIYILNSSPLITNCIIRRNSGENGGGIAMRFLAGAVLKSNLIYENTGNGLMIMEHSNPRLVNNTIINNTGHGLNGTVGSIPILVNNIVYGNTVSSLNLVQRANALVSYCDIEGGFIGNKNLDVDPQFDNSDPDFPFQLMDGSPLEDAGNTESTYNDYSFPPSNGSRVSDIGAYGGPLGGAWRMAEVSISIYQNPAFPQWLDIFVSSLDSFTTAPLCSLEHGESGMIHIPLSQNEGDVKTWLGSFEASGSGELFLTVDAELPNGHVKVGRTYQLRSIQPQQGGQISIAGVDGILTLSADSFDRSMVILTGCELNPNKPREDLQFLSPSFFIRGLRDLEYDPAQLSFNVNLETWTSDEKNRAGIYRLEGLDWVRIESIYSNGKITGETRKGGTFVLALGSGELEPSEGYVPEINNIVRAYPNPFNQKVTIEFSLSTPSDVKLSIYDLAGRRIVQLINGQIETGYHTAVWDGSSPDGNPLPSGIYWIRFTGPAGEKSVKLLLLR